MCSSNPKKLNMGLGHRTLRVPGEGWGNKMHVAKTARPFPAEYLLPCASDDVCLSLTRHVMAQVRPDWFLNCGKKTKQAITCQLHHLSPIPVCLSTQLESAEQIKFAVGSQYFGDQKVLYFPEGTATHLRLLHPILKILCLGELLFIFRVKSTLSEGG